MKRKRITESSKLSLCSKFKSTVSNVFVFFQIVKKSEHYVKYILIGNKPILSPEQTETWTGLIG